MSDFLQLKGLTGELKIAHRKGAFGLTLSTRELVVQKPHQNYYILLEHIVSLVPCDSVSVSGKENERAWPGSAYFSLYAQEVVVHNRSGIHRTGAMEFRLPIYRKLIEGLAKYSGLTAVD